MPRRLLLVLVALGLFLDPAHAQSPSANRYVTGPTHLRVESVATDLNRRTTQAGSFQSGRLLFAVAFRPGTDGLITGGIRMPIVVWDAATGTRRQTIAALPE